MPAGLWVVATPIGNLGDLSPRALAALEQADFILCEDTRRAAQLLAATLGSGGGQSLERLDAHASPKKLEVVAHRLAAGESAALITDAGTPAISDPGSALVRLCREKGVRITGVPGPSSVPALLSVCGFEETAFAFRGFLPRKAGEIREELKAAAEASKISRVFVWFESPQRIEESLALLAEQSPDSDVVAAKELSKLHEKLFAGSASQVAAQVREELAREGARGEWCFAVRFPELKASESAVSANSSDWVKALECLLSAGVSASEAARQVSQHFGVARNEAYTAALAKKSK